MTEETQKPAVSRRAGGWGLFILICGCVIFGMMMSWRTEMESRGERAFVAACAAFVLALAISQFRKVRR
jgi:hypothetical protein